MIAWLNPPALWGLAAALGAVVVHLLFRQRARRVAFPSLRFVQPSFISALRPRRPTDAILLALRGSILAVAALALAQPLVVASSRARAWDARVARAIVVDISGSMRAAAAAADDAALAESAGTVAAMRIEAADLGRGIEEAATWLVGAPPGRREIVVISDFQQGALPAAAVERVPIGIGLRFVKLGTLPPSRDYEGAPLLGTAGVAASRVHLDGNRTSVEIGRSSVIAEGLDILGPGGAEHELTALRRIAAGAGTPAPSAREPIVVVLEGGQVPAPLQRVSRAWMLQSVLALRANEDLLAIGAPSADARADGPWVAVLQDADGTPLVRAAAAGDRLVLDVAASPSSLLAAAAVRGALLARVTARSDLEQEIVAIPDDELAAWRREAPAATRSADAWRHAGSDARWPWVLVLVLLGIEALVRRHGAPAREEQTHAA